VFWSLRFYNTQPDNGLPETGTVPYTVDYRQVMAQNPTVE
jgi:hypothetical protein